MLLYSLYLWLRRPRRGRLEADRRRACMVILTILTLIFLESEQNELAADTWMRTTGMAAANARSLTASLLRSSVKPEP